MAAFVATWKDMSRRPQQVIGAEHGMSFRGSFPFCFLHFPKTFDSFPIFKWTLILWSTIILLYAGCDLPLRLRTYPFRFYPGCRGAMTARESGDSPCLRRHESSMNHPVQLVVLVCKSFWRTRMHEILGCHYKIKSVWNRCKYKCCNVNPGLINPLPPHTKRSRRFSIDFEVTNPYYSTRKLLWLANFKMGGSNWGGFVAYPY